MCLFVLVRAYLLGLCAAKQFVIKKTTAQTLQAREFVTVAKYESKEEQY